VHNKVEFAGGDKPADECKDISEEQIDSYKSALAEIVKAVSIAHCVGKTPENF